MLLDFHNVGILAPSIPETELHFQKTIHSVYLKRVFYSGIVQFLKVPLSPDCREHVSTTDLNYMYNVCLLGLEVNHILYISFYNFVSPFFSSLRGD